MIAVHRQTAAFRLLTSLLVVLAFLACRLDSPPSPSPSALHLSAHGADSNPGTEAAPWRTLDKANKSALAGDVVILHEGLYEGGVSPLNNGQEGRPIVFRAAVGERVRLDAATGIHLKPNSQYITIDGFEIHARQRVADVQGASYVIIRNCRLYGGRGTYQSFNLSDCSYCSVQNNYLDREDPDANGSGGDGLVLRGRSHHNVIEGNTVTRCEHAAFSSPYGGQSYNVWRNNRAFANHTNYALFDGVKHCVFEGNTGYYQGLVWTGGSGNCLQFTGSNCIIRFNTLYDDTATAYPYRQWLSVVGAGSSSSDGQKASVRFNKIYNNTICGENDQKEWKKSGWRTDNYSADLVQGDNSFKNNIFASAPDAQVEDIDVAHPLPAMSNYYEGNLLYGGPARSALIRYEYAGGNTLLKLAQVKVLKPKQWAASNKDANPLFVNTTGQGPAKDFSLRRQSPAVDAGIHLTTAANSGRASLTLRVADAGYFMDGWGIPGVVGDSLKIEGGPPVGIGQIEYADNAITLNSPRTWDAGARIFYYRYDRFHGSAPDVGAHESLWISGLERERSTEKGGGHSP